MSSVNQVIIIGNVGKDPELKSSASGASVCEISVCTSRTRKDKISQESIKEDEWHRVTLFGAQAELADRFLEKGSKVFIRGRLKTNKWRRKDGTDVFSTVIVSEELVFLSTNKGSKDMSKTGAAVLDQQLREEDVSWESNDRFVRPTTGQSKVTPKIHSESQNNQKLSIQEMDDDIPF